MRWKEINESPTVYYHGSMVELPVGTVLKPSSDYEAQWASTDFYSVLEHYRPSNMLGHREAVFMVDNDADLDNAGGGTEFVFTVRPDSRIEKHDLNWSSEISSLIGDGLEVDSREVQSAADAYWSGKPHPNESVWEYLTPFATILTVEEF